MAQLCGLAHLGKMIFIPHSIGIFHLSSIKKFVMSLENYCLITQLLSGFKFLRIFYNKTDVNKSVCIFQSMKSPVELNSLFFKVVLLYHLVCYIMTCKRGLYVKSFCFFETIAQWFNSYKLKCSHIIYLTYEKNKKLIKENSIPPFRADLLARVHTENFHFT